MEFLRRCEHLLLSVVADSRFVSYLPSVLAIATMMHVIDQVEPFNPLGCQKQLLGLPNISKGKVNECYQLIVETAGAAINREISGLKRRRYYGEIPRSPSGAIGAYFRCESPNDSLAVASSSSSVSSSPVPLLKKTRVHEQPMPLPSLSRPFVEDGNGSPR
ncbi:hypothetical protein Nepgr_018136 [Nepenthes gracilis]|uniref:Cyclin C-terminal domain-containing protein n=1 Tax=Nepenthes gracilis TaxID=150966 RepID=A0AAD3SQR0_NEPGR|nr:hypothetical protein Nepgr_018136 [Nepenthes gracilis]